MITSLPELYSVGTNKKSDFYELWQQHRQLKTMEMSEAWADIYYEGYNINSKLTTNSRDTKFKDIFPWNISKMITKTALISTRIVINYAMKQDIPFWVWRKVNGNWEKHMIRIS